MVSSRYLCKSNDTAEEKTVHVTVKDVEVRIAADKDTTAEIAPLQDIIGVSVPTIDLSATTGADGSTMYYADEVYVHLWRLLWFCLYMM